MSGIEAILANSTLLCNTRQQHSSRMSNRFSPYRYSRRVRHVEGESAE